MLKSWLYAIFHPSHASTLESHRHDLFRSLADLQRELDKVQRFREEHEELQASCERYKKHWERSLVRQNGLEQELSRARASHDEAMNRLNQLGDHPVPFYGKR